MKNSFFLCLIAAAGSALIAEESGRTIPTQQPLSIASDTPVDPTHEQLKNLLEAQVARVGQVHDAYQKGVSDEDDVARSADAVRKTTEKLGADKRAETIPWAYVTGAFFAGVLVGRYL